MTSELLTRDDQNDSTYVSPQGSAREHCRELQSGRRLSSLLKTCIRSHRVRAERYGLGMGGTANSYHPLRVIVHQQCF